MVKATDVFTPNKVPTITYVQRDEEAEQKARDAFEIPNIVVSLSGPSKSGKTVLVNKVVEKDHLITVSGASIRQADDLWNKVLGWMDVPLVDTKASSKKVGADIKAGASGEAGVIFAKAKAEGSAGLSGELASTTTSKFTPNPLDKVAAEIADSAFVVFVDDFHYIGKEIQVDIGRQMKFAAEKGVKICTASVPHRSDDVVRSNPELRGRVQAINLKFWNDKELQKIAEAGFEALNMDLAPIVLRKLIAEAFGSPQLMQTICLNVCLEKSVKETLPEYVRVEISDADLESILERTSNFMDFVSLVEALHSGPKQRGNERKQFEFKDESSGDVYRSILLAMADDPPRLSITYDEMLRRVRAVIPAGDGPVGSSVAQALVLMGTIAETIQPTYSVIEWDENVLDIVDPYFLFFLRSSPILDDIARAHSGEGR
jgi:molybdopterin-guanine dinucleotide biosynthesis protein